MEDDVELHELKNINIEGGCIIDGFPSVGLVSTIAANYIINQLDLERVGVITSSHFPVASIIRNGVPSHPVRMYAGHGVLVFISEFRPPSPIVKSMAQKILDYAHKKHCDLVISTEGLASLNEEDHAKDIEAFGVGSSSRAREILHGNKIKELKEGMITGISGMLLNEGERMRMDVICLIAEARANFPDARAGAKLVELIDVILPKIEIDTTPLVKEAERLENEIKKALASIQSHLAKHDKPVEEMTSAQMLYR
jgi:uncharacterized protein